MESAKLREHLANDFARLREVAGGTDLATPVPSCPGWTLADLVQHVGAVYLHKVECMRRNSHPEPWPPEGLADEPPLALIDRTFAALDAEFASRAPDSPAFTWYGPDQTVGFWIRRMAQETVVHRIDAELAAGVEPAPVDDDLAVDGIDEFLVAFVEYGSTTWPDEYGEALATTDGSSVRLETAGANWLIRLTPDGIQVRVSDTDDTAAIVSGKPADLLRWVWNRADDSVVSISGDAELLAALRRVFTSSAQ